MGGFCSRAGCAVGPRSGQCAARDRTVVEMPSAVRANFSAFRDEKGRRIFADKLTFGMTKDQLPP